MADPKVGACCYAACSDQADEILELLDEMAMEFTGNESGPNGTRDGNLYEQGIGIERAMRAIRGYTCKDLR